MESLAPVAGALGVKVAIVEPGPVHTEFVASTRAASVPVLTSNIEGYAPLIAAYSQSIGNVFEEHGQSGDDIALVIAEIANDKNPHLRYATSDYAKAFVGQKYTDITGDSIVEVFSARLKSD